DGKVRMSPRAAISRATGHCRGDQPVGPDGAATHVTRRPTGNIPLTRTTSPVDGYDQRAGPVSHAAGAGAARHLLHPADAGEGPAATVPLIGRASEVALLHRSIDGLSSRGGGVILLTGDAGIGKSRLVVEARGYAAAGGALVLDTACFPHDGGYPYAPVI